MPDQERAMLAYAQLAALSQQKGQLPSCDKFLILAAAAGCRGGWPDVSERCRELVLSHNPAHLIRNSATFVETMRTPEFEQFLKQLERFCNREKAEHLLTELGIVIPMPNAGDSRTVGKIAHSLLDFE
jgi:hypothetical protein